MESTFKIIPNKNLILETLSQDIKPKDYSKLKHEEFHHKLFNRKYSLITDLRNFQPNGNKTLIQNIIDVFIENKGKAGRKKSAIVCKDVDLLNKITVKNNSDSEIKVFKSPEEAENWLKQ